MRAASLALIAVTLAWGVSFTVVKSALEDVSAPLFLAMRFTLASAALAGALRLRGRLRTRFTRRTLAGGAAAGFVLWAAYMLQTAGLALTTPSKSAFVTSLNIVLAPLLACFVYRSVPALSEALGVALAIWGTGWMTLPEGAWHIDRGDLLTAGGALAFAVHIVAVGWLAPRTAAGALTLAQLTCVAALSWLSAAAAPVSVRWSWRLAGALALTSVVCTAVAFLTQAWAQQRLSAARTALIFALEPVAAAGASYLSVGEVLSPRAAAGAALILCGLLAAEWKSIRIMSRPAFRGGQSE